MIPTDKVVAIAERLLERSRKNEVVWYRVTDESTVQEYNLNLEGTIIAIIKFSPDTEPDSYTFWIGKQAPSEMFGKIDAQDPTSHWELLSNLMAEAERHVTGWDRVLDRIERRLDAEGPIGNAPPDSGGPVPGDNSPPTDDNVPF